MSSPETTDQSVCEDVLTIRLDGNAAWLTFNRAEKRNAINDVLLAALSAFFADIPEGVRVVVLRGAGGHFSSGLDLAEQSERKAEDVLRHSRGWHAVMDLIQFSGIPVVSLLEGAVMGGGLEIAASTHVRIAEPSALYRLPEGKRGIFVGGGATVRLGRIIGPDRMTEMMLTGRTYDAGQGQELGLSHYLVEAGQGEETARELASEIAANASLVNYLIIQSIARINDMARSDGLYAESLSAALSQSGPDAKEGLRAFLEKRKPRFS
ncbi:crotonase/enoyl-CoA hydratase family protein [Mesorhizobium sp. Z1-4]|uniref:crotonase/enoyl-CoA hydratase family protein n=1 Tax=Mesorhizobium sp. Z1-4 TaxID=2448478 RepID=UPI000FD7D0F5|nr:crotonase/enoyl-CoA hydratase family protein [Mesorhizobium sp. Z1-4]